MKFILALFIASLSFSSVYAQNNLSANFYYQMIRNEQQNIGKEIYEYKTNVSQLNLKILTFQIKKSIGVVDSSAAYNNETALKNATVDLFKFFLSVSENEYSELLKMVENPDLDDKEYKAKVQSLFKSVSEREKPYDEKFNTALDNYIKKYSIKAE